MPTTVLGIDLETTSPEDGGHITEIAAVLWDVENKRTIKAYSTLVRLPEGVAFPYETQQLTHLNEEQLDGYGADMQDVFEVLKKLGNYASYTVAHNKAFEVSFLSACGELGEAFVNRRRWIDTMTDLPLPEYYKGSKSLGALAYENGLINPFPHSALGDTMVMLQLLSSYPWPMVERLANSPTVRLIANVSFEQKDSAKEAGFRWDPAPAKEWFMDVKDFQAQSIANKCDFIVTQRNPNGSHTNLSINKPILV